MQPSPRPSMRTYYLILIGSFISGLGSYMTNLGLSIWIYQETRSATAFSTLLFFMLIPAAVGGLLAGPYVARWNRQRIMIMSDVIASLTTLALLLLFVADLLQPWHLYVTFAISGVANAFGRPAFGASIPLLVPKERLGRAAGIAQMLSALAPIIGAPLAGLIVTVSGLGLLFAIDFITFGLCLLVLICVTIPQPLAQDNQQQHFFWEDLRGGLQYIWARKPLLYLMGFVTLFVLLNDILYALFGPLVMSFADAQAFGLVYAAFGAGALASGVLLSLWGGPPRRMTGVVLGALVTSASSIIAGSWANVTLLMVSLFCYGAGAVLFGSLSQVIYQTKVAPVVLGRVLALSSVVQLSISAVGVLVAGPVATTFFEPLLMEGGLLATSVGALIGIGPGRGIGLIYMCVGIMMLLLTLLAVVTRIYWLEDQLADPAAVALPVDQALGDALVA